MANAAATGLVDIISIIIGSIIAVGAVAFLIWLTRRNKAMESKQKEMTAPETVHARVWALEKSRVVSSVTYYVHFMTDDGREIRLSVPRHVFGALRVSELDFQPEKVYHRAQSGILTYQGTELLAFENDSQDAAAGTL